MADADGCTAARRTIIPLTTSTGVRTPLRTQALQNRRRRQLTRSHAVVSFDSTCYYAAASPAPSSSSSSSLLNHRHPLPPDTPSPQPRRVDTMVLLRTDTHRHIRVVRQEDQVKSVLNASQVQNNNKNILLVYAYLPRTRRIIIVYQRYDLND